MKPEFHWTEERDAELLRLRARGKSFSQVAKAFGCTRNMIAGRVFRLARGAGNIQFWSADEEQQLVALWKTRGSVDEFAGRIGRSRCAIYNRAVMLGLHDKPYSIAA